MADKKKVAVVAIGGNSLIKSKQHQTVQDQYKAAQETSTHLVDMIEAGWDIAVGHGNGPQVGMINNAMAALSREDANQPNTPLSVCVAMSQAYIGYDLQNALREELRKRGFMRTPVVTVVTQVRVDENDPAFKTPAKPVGEFFDANQVDDIKKEYPNWSLVEDAGRGYRRVVPSPAPIEVVERPVIESLLCQGYHVVAAGGGGIPVVKHGKDLDGVDAVIDKDLVSSLLAEQLGADLLIISTAVEQVALNFGKQNQELIGTMTVSQAEGYIAENHFAPGSMLPKIEAALEFLRNGGKEVIITAPEFINDAVRSGKGTHIVP